jgi:hypothetical protein
MRFLIPVLVLVTTIPAIAHHPFSAFYDGSKLVSMTGTIAELRVENPHIVVVVQATGPDGRVGRWAFEGPSPNAFRAKGVKNLRTRLRAGTAITISGWAAEDPTVRAFSGHEVTFGDGTKLIFAAKPGDGWQCLNPNPCGHYPKT